MKTKHEQTKSAGRRRRIYRNVLKSVLVAGVAAVLVLGYKQIYDKVPARIKLKAGVDQILDLNVPVEGTIVRVSDGQEAIEVSGQEDSNIPGGSIYIDLSSAVTMRANVIDTYQMNLKLFGFIPFKQVNIEVIQDMMLTPVGTPIGIYVKTEGVLVIGIGEFDGPDGKKQSPARYLLQTGDYILKVDGEEVSGKSEFIKTVEESKGERLVLTVRRGSEEFELGIQPRQNQSGEYKIGIWVRDNAQGVGTLTFVDEWGNFGALGHGISDVDTSALLTLKSGTLYETEIIAIRKGSDGDPGEMTGLIEYADKNILGEIQENTSQGIYGVANEKLKESIDGQALPIALKQEIHTGPAQILCSVEGEPRYYDVEIREIYLEQENVNRGILLSVTDPELLAFTGGIIQGMSGAPIIQDGKLIGAVTHVLVQDSTSGYGIFIENMLTH